VPGREPGRESARKRTGDRARATSSGPRWDRLIMVFAGVALVLLSVGLVFADVREAGNAVPAAPRDQDMTLTVPSMKRVKEIPVYGGPVKDETALHNGTLHVDDTGFPWQEEANVYIAGHRLGYPRTDSFLVFWDLNELKRGQRVLLTDSEDTRYVYKVFDRQIVGPDEVSVKKPIEGKNIVSLQTCTLPDYKERLVVRAELVRTVKAPVRQAAEGGLPARSG
jgi:sortase A